MSDLEVISLNLTSEYLSIDNELQLFRKLPNSLINKIERSVYNRRKRKLALFMEQIPCKIAMEFDEFEDIFIVDSMPMKICENARASRCKICKEEEFSSPNDCTLIGDKAYLSVEVQVDLFNYAHIQLDTPMRENQKDYKP